MRSIERFPRIPQHVLETTNRIVSGAFGITAFNEEQAYIQSMSDLMGMVGKEYDRNPSKVIGLLRGGIKIVLPAASLAGEKLITDPVTSSSLRLGLAVLTIGALTVVDLGSIFAPAYFAPGPYEFVAIRGAYNLAVESVPEAVKAIGGKFSRKFPLHQA